MYYYPGAEFVDIIGIDDYHEDTVIYYYDALTQFGKPFGFAEKGPPLATAGKTSHAFVRLDEQLKEKYPLVSFFIAYSGSLALIRNFGAADLLKSQYIINQEKLGSVLH